MRQEIHKALLSISPATLGEIAAYIGIENKAGKKRKGHMTADGVFKKEEDL